MDITVIVFVFSMLVVGMFLTATIRRDFIKRKQITRDLRREVNHVRARRRPAHRP